MKPGASHLRSTCCPGDSVRKPVAWMLEKWPKQAPGVSGESGTPQPSSPFHSQTSCSHHERNSIETEPEMGRCCAELPLRQASCGRQRGHCSERGEVWTAGRGYDGVPVEGFRRALSGGVHALTVRGATGRVGVGLDQSERCPDVRRRPPASAFRRRAVRHPARLRVQPSATGITM